MITDNLTHTVYFSSLLPEKCPVLNAHIVDALRKREIPFTYLKGTKDIWCRDYMPIQIEKNRFVFYRYTPDYLQDKTGLTLQTNPELVFQEESNELLRLLPMSMEEEIRFDRLRPISISHPVFHRFELELVMDGGNVVKCGDKVVMTDKVFVENKDKTPQEVQRQIEEAFQCEVVFLPWDRNEEYGHCDGIIHCLGDNRVLMTNYADFNKGIADEYLRILEKYFDVTILKYNVKRKHMRSWSYINFLQIGTLVLVPQLGIPEDDQALEQISSALPDCEIVGIPALEAVRRGGALNCISWNIKV
ncbi:MAG: agmatine deiminase family protein [Bacteroidales bacterium]|nr:agmatine deiminase family protein [Bacteroidales bacterium]